MKAGIVGCGFVGSSVACAMVLRGTVNEIVLIDLNRKLAENLAEDILDATPIPNPVHVVAGDFPLLANAGVVILACGVGPRPGETRLQLFERNLEIFKKVITLVLQFAPEAVLLTVSEPVDVITQMVIKLSRIDPGRVVGSGTILETGLFRTLLGDHLGVAPLSVHGYVLGEHGDSEVLVWSSATAGGISIQDYAKQMGVGLTEERKSEIEEGVRRATARIVGNTGESYHAIGASIAQIVQAIRGDERRVLTVSSLTTGMEGLKGITLSLPRVIGAKGILTELRPDLSSEELLALKKSADILKEAVLSLNIL